MKKISVYIIAYNEEDKIEAALRSVTWADEIVVIDSYSTDRTVEIAKKYTSNIVQLTFESFGKLRNDALTHLSGEWIFSLDSDEICTPAAAEEIRSTIESADAKDAYFIPRRNFFMGRWIKYSGWYPDYRQPQLFRRGKMTYTMDAVHESYVLTGSIGKLTEPIAQVPFKDLEQLMFKSARYSSLGVQRVARDKPNSGMGTALLHASASFIRHYLLRRGFLDGWAGFMIAFSNFEGTFYKYAKFHESRNIKHTKLEIPQSLRK